MKQRSFYLVSVLRYSRISGLLREITDYMVLSIEDAMRLAQAQDIQSHWIITRITIEPVDWSIRNGTQS